MKRKIRIIIDILMFLLFLYLLSYRPGMGLMYHAVVGIAAVALHSASSAESELVQDAFQRAVQLQTHPADGG